MTRCLTHERSASTLLSLSIANNRLSFVQLVRESSQGASDVRRFFDEVVLPGFLAMQVHIKAGNTLEDIRAACEFFRAHGVQSPPVLAHGIDFVTNSPHISTDGVRAFPYERIIQPGMTLMLEPCPITPDGLLGMFFGHTYIIAKNGVRRVTTARMSYSWRSGEHWLQMHPFDCAS